MHLRGDQNVRRSMLTCPKPNEKLERYHDALYAPFTIAVVTLKCPFLLSQDGICLIGLI